MTSDGLAEPLKVPASHRAELRALLALRDTARALLAAEASTLEDTAEIAELPLPAERPLPRLPAPLRADQPLHAAAHRPHRPRHRRGADGPRHPDRGPAAALRPVRRARAGARELRRDHPDRHAGRDPLRAGRGPARAAARRRHPAGRARDLPGHPRPRRPRRDRPPPRHRPSRRRARSSASSSTRTLPSSGWCPRPSTCPGTSAPSSTTPARPRIERPELEVNVRALERVLPADLTVEEIEPRLGAVWIDADTHRQFLAEILEDPDIQVEHPGGAMWAVKGRTWSVQATSVWGTEPDARPARSPRPCSEQRPIQVTDETDDGRRVRQPDRDRRRPRESPGAAGALRRVVLGGPRPRPPARRRVQPPVQRDRAARLQHRGRAAHPPRPRAHLHAAAASARRGRADARRARRRALSPGRRRQDRRDGDRRDGAPPPRPRLKARASWCPTTCSSSSPASGCSSTPKPGCWPPSSDDLAGERRRAFVARTAANDWDAVILTRSAFARLPRLAGHEDRLHPPRARAAARDARALQRRRRPDRQAAGEADPARGGTPPGAAGLAARSGR